jgi:hypothetical protein
MKLFINHLDSERIKKDLYDVSHIDFSLFIDDVPKNQNDLSSINILVLQEPNEYFGLHDWAIQNKDLFQVIMTWDDRVINNCSNAIFFKFGNTWFTPEQYGVEYTKKFQLSHLCGKLLKTYGQSIRHEILARKNEIKIPTKFFDVYGDRYDIKNAREGKAEIFGDSMFGIAIENTSHNGYFTEKIIDCFLLKTIPIYWGCSDIDKYFDKEGIIKFENADDLIYISNTLNEEYYTSRKDAIEKNYQLALDYLDYEKTIIDKIKEIFTLNNII